MDNSIADTINGELAEWLKRRAETEYAQDVSAVVLYGSYVNGTAGINSDIDCYYIPATKSGLSFGGSFIIKGIGYDIYPVTWKRLRRIANLKNTFASMLTDAMIIYVKNDKVNSKLISLKNNLIKRLGNKKYTRNIAKERLSDAVKLYNGLPQKGNISEIRQDAAFIILRCVDAIAVYNGKFFHYGIKFHIQELREAEHLPNNFLSFYNNIIQADAVNVIIGNCYKMCLSVSELLDIEISLNHQVLKSSQAITLKNDLEPLSALYCELASTFNKIVNACTDNNYSLAFLSAAILQKELFEIFTNYGFREYDVLSYFRYDKLKLLSDRIIIIRNNLKKYLENAKVEIKKFDDMEEFKSYAKNYRSI